MDRSSLVYAPKYWLNSTQLKLDCLDTQFLGRDRLCMWSNLLVVGGCKHSGLTGSPSRANQRSPQPLK